METKAVAALNASKMESAIQISGPGKKWIVKSVAWKKMHRSDIKRKKISYVMWMHSQCKFHIMHFVFSFFLVDGVRFFFDLMCTFKLSLIQHQLSLIEYILQLIAHSHFYNIKSQALNLKDRDCFSLSCRTTYTHLWPIATLAALNTWNERTLLLSILKFTIYILWQRRWKYLGWLKIECW